MVSCYTLINGTVLAISTIYQKRKEETTYRLDGNGDVVMDEGGEHAELVKVIIVSTAYRGKLFHIRYQKKKFAQRRNTLYQ